MFLLLIQILIPQLLLLALAVRTGNRATKAFVGDPLPIRIEGRYIVRGDRL